MDQLIHVEVLDRHGEVAHRHAARTLPVRIGRAYDNDLILEDPYVAPHHAVVQRAPTGELEIVDAGSRNGLFRARSRERVERERIDPGARYRVGRTEIRVRSSAHAVADELVDRPTPRREPIAAFSAVLAVLAAVLLYVWGGTIEPLEPAKLAQAPMTVVLALLLWSAAWALAGRVFLGASRFAAHVTVAALAFLGAIASENWDYVAFALSAPAAKQLAIAVLVACLAWGLWRHLSLVMRNPGRGTAAVALAVAAGCVGLQTLSEYVARADNLTHMTYLKAVKAPPVRLAKGGGITEFFAGTAALADELRVSRGQ